MEADVPGAGIGLPWILGLGLYLVFYGLSARWVYRDACRRGEDGWYAVAFVSMAAWPASLFVWWFIRGGYAFHHDGTGSAWG
jgi:hypothetical protein